MRMDARKACGFTGDRLAPKRPADFLAMAKKNNGEEERDGAPKATSRRRRALMKDLRKGCGLKTDVTRQGYQNGRVVEAG